MQKKPKFHGLKINLEIRIRREKVLGDKESQSLIHFSSVKSSAIVTIVTVIVETKFIAGAIIARGVICLHRLHWLTRKSRFLL